MALPTYDEQVSLDYIVNGAPCVNVTGNSNYIADGIHFIINGAPYYATSPSGGGAPVYNTTQFFLMF